ncbi:hypothetical protein DIPPA_03980 [Diplonema papillatum]|nr:hypothetical protein DIPPA_03972 [Diplonema papillatum]KAJ9445537.1 hypothetical protein DIPPA_03980 [Diplonema papillatum]
MRRAASHGARLAARGFTAQGQQGRGLHAVAKAELEGEQHFLKDLLRPPGWAVECTGKQTLA